MINTSISKGFAFLTTFAGLGVINLPVQAQAPIAQETLVADMQIETAQMNEADQMNIVEVASSSDSFNTLVQAAQAAGLADTLASEGPYTVFAPTDEAFSQLPDGAIEFLTRPENEDLLREVLTYHVVSGEVTASELSTGKVEALGGGLAVRVTEDRVIVNDASVVNANIQASNGIIHAVNRVLMPRELRNQLVAALR
ncbi:MAG: fasciclin domain-containing protein [Chroococcales cyanobacterium]